MTSLDQPVSELMQREVVTLQQGDRLDLADDIMSLGRIRHLPVLDGEQLVGMLSNRDLLAASLSKALEFEAKHRRTFMRSVEVKEVMTQDVDTVLPEGAVVVVHPNTYHPDAGYMVFGDTSIITADGFERLGATARRLIVVD